ncbi:hypothetical protein BJY04DRAFT_214826 [Aspergillus karnatakaensis]|uniref:uncharacterized protein n=1 Tax=Aspergillus karnatakaensis TaxID=1810916 RepID=UPI003CCD0751
MKAIVSLKLLGLALGAATAIVGLAVPTSEILVEELDQDILEAYRPTDAERAQHPNRLWYFDHPALFPNGSFYLTNDYGTSSAYLVDASARGINYINSYSQGGCIPDTFRSQTVNPEDGVCREWVALIVKSIFVVGYDKFQVNAYSGQSNWCRNHYVGGIRG